MCGRETLQTPYPTHMSLFQLTRHGVHAAWQLCWHQACRDTREHALFTQTLPACIIVDNARQHPTLFLSEKNTTHTHHLQPPHHLSWRDDDIMPYVCEWWMKTLAAIISCHYAIIWGLNRYRHATSDDDKPSNSWPAAATLKASLWSY